MKKWVQSEDYTHFFAKQFKDDEMIIASYFLYDVALRKSL